MMGHGGGYLGDRDQCAEAALRSLADAFFVLVSVMGFLSDSPASSTRCMRCRTPIEDRVGDGGVADPARASARPGAGVVMTVALCRRGRR